MSTSSKIERLPSPSTRALTQMHEVFQGITGYSPLFLFERGAGIVGVRPFPPDVPHPLAGVEYRTGNAWTSIETALSALDELASR